MLLFWSARVHRFVDGAVDAHPPNPLARNSTNTLPAALRVTTPATVISWFHPDRQNRSTICKCHRHQLLFRVVGAIRLADPREQQAQVVVDLGDGADGRARVVRRRFLLDRDRRRQAFDQIDVGLFHGLQELPRIGRQRLDVAALALGVERVEGERALPSRIAGNNDPVRGRRDAFFKLCVRAPKCDVFLRCRSVDNAKYSFRSSFLSDLLRTIGGLGCRGCLVRGASNTRTAASSESRFSAARDGYITNFEGISNGASTVILIGSGPRSETVYDRREPHQFRLGCAD